MAMSRFRTYFRDAETGAELADHWANGREWSWSGRCECGKERHREPGHRLVRYELQVIVGREFRKVTAEDFGGRAVRVRVWHPAQSEVFLLVPAAK